MRIDPHRRCRRDFATTRDALHAVAEQVARGRPLRATDRIGLRATSTAGSGRRRSVTTRSCASTASSSCTSATGWSGARRAHDARAAAAFVGVAARARRRVYPPATAARPGRPARDRADGGAALADWYRLAGSAARPSYARFTCGADATRSAALARALRHRDSSSATSDAGTRANFGASPGDADIPEPYLYVGPWDPDRRTGGFAAVPVRRRDDLRRAREPRRIRSARPRDVLRACPRLLLGGVAGSRVASQPMAQTFTRMDQSTAEQWAVIGKETSEHQGRVAERALEMLRSLADITDGSRSTSSRTRCRPRRAPSGRRRPDEMVFASLLHDIGKAVSVPNHPEIAAAIIKPYVRPEVYEMIRAHQDFQGRHYYHHFGGDPNARDKYEGAPWFDLAAQFADEWDQTAFDPDYDTLPLEHFEPLVREMCARPLVLTRRPHLTRTRGLDAARWQGRDRFGRRPRPRPGQRQALAREGRDRRARGAQRRLPRRGAGRDRSAGGRALAVPTNLVDAEQAAALVRARSTTSAGSTSSSTTRSAWTRRAVRRRSTSTHWRKIFEVNVWGALGLTQPCVPHLRGRGRSAATHRSCSSSR